MPDATVTAATIRPEEAAHFGKLAKDWWDPKGSSAMLHRLNPVRLAFLREAIDLHWGGDPESVKPLAGRTALDVGCGAGLLAEPLARLGAVPKGTHHWNDFIAPEELRELLADAGLTMGEPAGIAFSPLHGLRLSSDLSLNYVVTATRA